jgi:hypothetical protein
MQTPDLPWGQGRDKERTTHSDSLLGPYDGLQRSLSATTSQPRDACDKYGVGSQIADQSKVRKLFFRIIYPTYNSGLQEIANPAWHIINTIYLLYICIDFSYKLWRCSGTPRHGLPQELAFESGISPDFRHSSRRRVWRFCNSRQPTVTLAIQTELRQRPTTQKPEDIQ